MFEFLFKKKQPTFPFLGAELDTRSEEEKQGDYHISEILSAASVAPVDWKEKHPTEIRVFPVQNQGMKSDCVAETRRKLYRILFKVNRGLDLDFSAVEFYRRRINYPFGGMQAVDAIDLCRKGGMTLDVLVPSDVVATEAKANALVLEPHNVDIAKVFTIPNEVTFTAGDIETPASTVQWTKKGIMMWFYFTAEEWSKEFVTVIDNTLNIYENRALKHSVTGVEPALYKGIKGFWLEDSAHFGGLARRFVTEDFYKKRNFWASYPINFQFEKGDNNAGNRPRFVEGDTRSLQLCLKFEGVFPVNTDTTGIYGPITTKAVKEFQKKYGLEQVGTVGPLTTAKLKSLYP